MALLTFLEQRWKQSRLILLYKGQKGKASLHTDDLVHPDRLSPNMHQMAFQTLHTRTVRDWNELPVSLLSTVEDAEDCIARFTNLIRSRN